jgi:DNA recombination protein RmuC
MGMTALVVLQLALLIALIAWLILRARPPETDEVLRELTDLRARMDALAKDQSRVPLVLADARATQAEALSDEFARLTQTVGGQLASAQRSVDGRLDVAGEAVSAVRERLAELAEVTRRLEAMGKTVTHVHQLLRVPTSRGAFGEVWLEEILRQTFPDSLYTMQYTFPTGDRVDAVLRVGDRLVPIDAKFPLDACERMLSADGDDAAREQRTFDRSVRARIDEVADKYILPDHDTYEFAIMYIPAERVYYEALARGIESGLMQYAMSRHVILASPNTFYAYLSAILHGLRGLHVEQHAQEILGALDATQARVDGLLRVHEVLGRHLDNAMKQYGEADRQLRSLSCQIRDLTGPDATVQPPVLPPFAG